MGGGSSRGRTLRGRIEIGKYILCAWSITPQNEDYQRSCPYDLVSDGKPSPATLPADQTLLPQLGVRYPACDAFGIFKEHLIELSNETTEYNNETDLVVGDLVKTEGGPGSEGHEEENPDEKCNAEDVLLRDSEEPALFCLTNPHLGK